MKAASTFQSLALAAGCMIAATAGTACEPGFDPSNKLNSLRVLAVSADNPYPKPGGKVHFEMLWHDGASPVGEPRKNIQILWIAGCFDPIGDLYYACYPELGKLFGPGGQPAPEALKYFGTGNSFDLDIPADIVSRRPPREGVEAYGTIFVFFAVCAGQIRPTELTGSSSIPLGCYDETGKLLGAEDFVPGYLNLYSYEDRSNQNPIVTGFDIDGKSYPESDPIPDTHVRGCRSGDCADIAIKPIIDRASAEVDPGAITPDGTQLTEMVWVDYYASAGKLAKSARLVNDASKGWNEDLGVKYTPPEPGVTAVVYAVVHDSRGGIGWVKRTVVGD
jgi:hypothetical protein